MADVQAPPAGPERSRAVLVLQPSKGWVSLDLAGVWEHRELLFFLTWRDIKLRYKQTTLGVLWAIIQPTAPMLIFTLVFGRLVDVPADGPYPLFAFAGLLPWTFFANAVTNSASSVVTSANLVTKVYFPRMIIPGSATLAALMDFVIGLGVLAVLMAWYHVPPHATLLVLPLLVALTTILALGVGMFFAALTVQYRDVRYALPFLIQFWMFATPIIFPSRIVPAHWQWAITLNPMAGIIENFRAGLFGRAIDWGALALSAAMAAGILAYAAFSFRRFERKFADLI
ncbi:MAG TPA: ABC transporter permease [Vicinamibacterales bacterium]|nr:ABC transporter permease [Vicinamibacterales bacterium]